MNRRPSRGTAWWLATAIVTLLASPGSRASGSAQTSPQASRDVRDLASGEPIQRPLAGGEEHAYRIGMTSGEFLHLVVEQHGIDVVVTALGPSGQALTEVDSPNGVRGPELLRLVAETAGDYRIVVRAPDAKAAAGAYEIAIRARRPATAGDRSRMAAETALAAGIKLKAPPRTAPALRSAIAQLKIAVPHWRAVGDREREATTLVELGDALLDLNENQEALSWLEPALTLWRAEAKLPEIADTLNTIGSAYEQMRKTDQALQYYTEALEVARSGGVLQVQGAALNNLATTYSAIGERDKTVAYLQQALAVFQAAGSERDQATALNNIGQVLNRMGENQRALDYLRRSLAIARQMKARFTELNLLNNIGSTYKSLGEYRRALVYHRDALFIAQELGNRVQEAKLLNNVGADYKTLGDHQTAIGYYERSLALARAAADKEGEARALGNIGAVLHENLAQPDSARDHLERALSLWREAGDMSGIANALAHLAQISIRRGDVTTALDYYQQTVVLARKDRDRNREAVSLMQLAILARNRGELGDARARAAEALAVVESLRRDVFDRELRATYLATVQRAYEVQVDILMRLHRSDPTAGFDAAALDVAERARARSLLEALSDDGRRAAASPALLERQRELQRRLDAVALAEAPSPPRLGGRDAAAANAEIERLVAESEEVRTQIRMSAAPTPDQAARGPLTTPELQRLLDPDTVLLEYALGDESSYVWLVASDSVRSAAIARRADIDTLAMRLYSLITARTERPPGETVERRSVRLDRTAQALPGAAAALSRALLGPLAPHLTRKRVVVVASGALQLIPFGMLPAPDGTSPLVVNQEVVNLPSGSTLAALREAQAGRAAPARTVAVVADPVFDAGDPRVEAHARRAVPDQRPATGSPAERTAGQDDEPPETDVERAASAAGMETRRASLPRLRYTRDEARAILALASPSRRLEALDFRANREMLTSGELASYRVVHVATHGFINAERAELSGIALSMVDARGRPVDGFLRLHQIHDLRLPVDLVVLSACQTALGTDVKGEGIIGLTRGFMSAGAARVVSSLWKVDDQATAELMRLFYRGMLGPDHLRPAAALRSAQLAMRRQARWADPYYWAGFTLQGEWR